MQELLQKNRDIIEQLEISVRYFRKQNYYYGNKEVKKLYSKFEKVMEVYIVNKELFNQYGELVNEDEWIVIIEETMQAQEREDYVLLADLLELNWLPRLLTMQMTIAMLLTDGTGVVADCEADNKKYIVEYTSVGSYTVKVISEEKEFYMHSNNNPYSEGEFFAENYISEDTEEYIVFGLGLGYHIKALALALPDARVTVYESDEVMIKLADEFGALDMSLPEFANVTIIEDIDYSKLKEKLNQMEDMDEFLIHTPSLKNISNQNIREKFEEYFISLSSIKNQKKYMDANFKKNVLRNDPNVDDIKNTIEGKTVVLVARGPSLEENIENLRYMVDDVVIVAVYSVAKYLIDKDIFPDYMLVSDAQTNLYNEVRDERLNIVPMIYLSTAANNVVESHNGDKYIMYQEDYENAEEQATLNGNTLFSVGGSVSTAIIDMCIRFKCSKLICLGLDLAYLDNRSHVKGTGETEIVDQTELRTVLSVDGKAIPTKKNLDIYRKWIERRIEGIEDIEFVNASSGAYINGMKNEKLDNNNILVYYGSSIYDSTVSFVQKLIEKWKLMNYNVVIIDTTKDDFVELFKKASKLKYEFVFSMNGVVAETKLIDGEYLQNYIDAPFISYMVDHPLYNIKRLVSKINNYHILMVDDNHVEYIKEHHSNIKTVRMLPHGGIGVSTSQITPYDKRKIDVLFMALYIEPEDILREISKLPEVAQMVVMNVIEKILKNNDMTVENALEEFIKENNIELDEIEYVKYISLMYNADRYIRYLYRSLAIKTLVSNGIKVHVFGNGWNKFKSPNPGNLIIGGSIDAVKSMELMANSKIVLNVMPWFKKGSHERVFNAMLNGAVCVTDDSTYLRSEFEDEKNIVFYSVKDMPGLYYKVKELLADPEKTSNIAQQGYIIAKKKHTWHKRAEEIIRIANEINGKEET